jgi:hypothetical protein
MDTDFFDDLTRSVSVLLSRRTLAGALGVMALGLPGLAEAKKHKHKHKHKKHKKHHPPTGCVPHCQGKVCGDDGCGGPCGSCPEEASCQQGACICPGGQRECQGACIPSDQCCSEGDCPAEHSCVGGRCCLPRAHVCDSGGDLCCGTDLCVVVSAGKGVCEVCLPLGSDCPGVDPNLCCSR